MSASKSSEHPSQSNRRKLAPQLTILALGARGAWRPRATDLAVHPTWTRETVPARHANFPLAARNASITRQSVAPVLARKTLRSWGSPLPVHTRLAVDARKPDRPGWAGGARITWSACLTLGPHGTVIAGGAR